MGRGGSRLTAPTTSLGSLTSGARVQATPPQTRVILVLLAISSLPFMANATISPALPGLAAAYAETPGIEMLAGLVLALPSVSIILTAVLFGWYLDRASWKPLLICGLLLYALGGAAAALMGGIPGLLLSRLALGLGGAAIMTTVSMLAAQLFEGASRDRFMGWQTGAMATGGIVFILIGGALAEISWRAPFLAYLVALPFILLAAALFRPLPGRFETARAHGPTRLAPGTVALCASLGFVTIAVFYLIPTKLPFHMAELGITSPTSVALAVAGVTLAGAPGAIFFGQIRARFSAPAIFALAFGVFAAGYGVIALANTLPMILLGTLLAGMGIGPAMPNIMSVLMAATPPQARGKAAGLVTTAFFAGQLAAPLLGGVLARSYGLPATFVTCAGALALLAMVSLLIARLPGRAVA